MEFLKRLSDFLRKQEIEDTEKWIEFKINNSVDN